MLFRVVCAKHDVELRNDPWLARDNRGFWIWDLSSMNCPGFDAEVAHLYDDSGMLLEGSAGALDMARCNHRWYVLDKQDVPVHCTIDEQDQETFRQADVDQVRSQIHRYFVAVHGEDYIYRAPEMFRNMLERWMLGIARGGEEGIKYADTCIAAIEEHYKEQ